MMSMERHRLLIKLWLKLLKRVESELQRYWFANMDQVVIRAIRQWELKELGHRYHQLMESNDPSTTWPMLM